jgi:hypothetical protein
MLISAVCLAQRGNRPVIKCATDTRLKKKFLADENFRLRFSAEQKAFSQLVARKRASRPQANQRMDGNPNMVPVVFHIVLQNPASVTDAQILSQLDILNKAYEARNDQSKLPAGFKSLVGTVDVQFCLAQRTPDNLPSPGIVRYTTNVASFKADEDKIKEASSGGADAWNSERFLNVWVGNLDNGILGYGTMPGTDDAAHQGIVIAVNSLPTVDNGAFSEGKTLVHESGHFFNLFHIWGDDEGSCTGTDEVNDTPNQADATYGPQTGVLTDNCTKTAPGIMYQNYMDYTDDTDLLLFTVQQTDRMELAFQTYRSTLGTSNGCQPVTLKTVDLEAQGLADYSPRVCAAEYVPRVIVRNRGTSIITSFTIQYRIGSGSLLTFNWSGSIASLETGFVTLPSLTLVPGLSTIEIKVSQPNGLVDQDASNNSFIQPLQYYPPVKDPFTESFENQAFPPPGWDIVNPDSSLTWERITIAAKTGTASIGVKNFNYDRVGEQDLIRLPELDLSNSDSTWLSFHVAAAAYSPTDGQNAVWDTLEVLVSTDCGRTYASLYKKWGASLVTIKTPVLTEFVPTASDWRKDSVDLSSFTGFGKIMVAIRNITGFENNLYLDDIKVRHVEVSEFLKEEGIVVSPNPNTGSFKVQFYPQPTGLKSIQLFDTRGSLIQRFDIPANEANSAYRFDMTRYASGIYILRAVFNDKVLVRRIVKAGQ